VFDVTLTSQQGMPAKDRPVFACRVLTASARLRLNQLLDKIATEPDDAVALNTTVEACGVFLTDWRNVGSPFSLSMLPDIATVQEIHELIAEYIAQSSVSEAELKKSLWPQESDQAPSVANAEEDA
jgi:hypothetical protein